MKIDIADIKRLKELSGAGLTDAKAALEESKGDFDKALKAMRQKGLTKAEKRSEREARAGVVYTYNHDNRIGVVIEVNCETDFVARNEKFQEFVKNLCLHIAAMNPMYLNSDSIPKNEIAEVKKELVEKSKTDKKPKDIQDKIIKGQLDKYFEEKTLDQQAYVKNPDIKIKDYLNETIAILGENIIIRRFNRFELGETI